LSVSIDLQRVPIPAYVFRVDGEDFVLEEVSAIGLSLNPGLESLYGRSMTRLYRDQPEAILDARRCVAERTTVVRETMVRRYDRTEKTQLVRLTYSFAPPDRMILFMQDIAGEEILQRALQESEARYRSLVASIPDGVLLRGANGRVLAVNDFAVNLLGARDQADLIGADRILGDGYQVRTEGGVRVEEKEFPSRRVLATGSPELGRVYELTGGGVVRWVRVAAQPIHGAAGVVTASVTTFTDITELVSAQRALRESATQLDLTLAAARMGVWGYDVATDAGSWSRNLNEIFDLSGTGTRLEDFLAYVHPEDRQRLMTAFTRLTGAAPDEGVELEFRIVGADGVTRWARVLGRRTSDGATGALAGTVVDVTEPHRLEEELRRAHRLESIGRLAGGIAHDFNNLLAAMMGSLDLVEAHCSEAGREDLDTIRHGAVRARDLTRQLLAFARKQPVEFKTIDLSALVHTASRMLKRLVGPGTEIVIDGEATVLVRADPSLLEQVLVNLVVNAGEAMPNGGRLHIRVAGTRASSGGSAPQDLAVLEVVDSGIGMDSETRRHVFDPFFTTKATGTGLGLASSYGIVQQHGGDILVESELMAGTRFRVLLPRLEGASPPFALRAEEVVVSPSPRKGWVLVVDDEDLVRKTAVRMLKSLGYDVLSAANAEEARRRSTEHPGQIDVLLCDLVMPDRDGPSIAGELQALRPELKVLFASGYAAGTSGADAVSAMFLPKPYGRAELAAKLDELKK
jgi:two-component system cell cycle sensor histidine kinase/response regulator CckA